MARVLITAGAAGIGLAMAQGFDAAGYDVWVSDVDTDALAQVPEHWRASRVDVTNEAQMAGPVRRDIAGTGVGWTCCARMPGLPGRPRWWKTSR